MKPRSPEGLSFQWREEAVTVTCSSLGYNDLQYEIQQKTLFDSEWQVRGHRLGSGMSRHPPGWRDRETQISRLVLCTCSCDCGLPRWLRRYMICLQCRTPGFNPWVGKTPLEEGVANPLQFSCLENPVDRRAWRAAVYGVAESRAPLSG